MFDNYTYEELDSEEAKDLIKVINTEASTLSDFLLFNLNVVNITIEELSSDKSKLVQTSAIGSLLEVVFMAKKVVTLIEEKKASIKITSSEIESILINCKAIINGVETIGKLNKENMLKTDSSELLVYLVV